MIKQSKDIELSIVIASGAGGGFLQRCLDSLKDQLENNKTEVIVVDRCGAETIEILENKYTFARVIGTPAEHRTSIPALRKIGVEQARADIVAVIEEHCIAAPDWIATILAEYNTSDAAIGGPVFDKDYDRVQDWVVYFSEYHNFLPPWEAGRRSMLNGVNIAYSREKLINHLDVLSEGYWEVVLHPVLEGDGDFRAIPNMRVHHSGPFDYKYYMEQRYLLSRVWGGSQRRKVSPIKRLAYLIIAPILPLLLLFRMTSRVLQSNQLLGKFLLSLPLLIPVTFAYVWGEWLGYLVGEGDALERVE